MKTPPTFKNALSPSSASSAASSELGTCGTFASSSGGRSYRSLSTGGGGSVRLLMPSRPALQHRREREVRVARRIGATELDALGLRALRVQRDAHRRRTVALRVHEVDRRFVAGHEPLVRVRGRRGEREDRRRVREQPADVPARHVGQTGVAGFVEEQRLAALPQRLVAVHARAVVLEDRLRHERGRLARGPRHVLHHVLVEHQLVGHAQQRVEAHVDLGLAGGADLVVLDLDLDAEALHREDHLGAQVLVLVHRRDGEVPLLVPDLVAEVLARLRRAVFHAASIESTECDAECWS